MKKIKTILLAVNININLLKTDQCFIDYLECISCAGARQVVKTPTRHSSDYLSNSLIDHVYTNLRCEKLSVEVVNYDISDHLPVVCEILCKKKENVICYQKSVQDFSKFDVGVFLNDLNANLGKLKMSITKVKM